MKKIIKLVILTLAINITSVAQDMNSLSQSGEVTRAGQTTMNFLLVGVSPKIAGRGNISASIGSGVESIFGNPAGLAEMSTSYQAFMSVTQWFADIKYLAAAVAWNTGNYGVFGLHVISIDYGKIKGAMLTDPDVGENNYILTGDVKNVGAYSIGLSYVKQVNTKFAIGGTMKYVTQQLGQLTNEDGSVSDNNQGKLAFDLGLRYYLGWKSLNLAMTMRNFSTFVRYQNESFSLPIIYTLGVGINMMELIEPSLGENNSILFSTEFVHPNNHSERINTGAEYIFQKMFTLRAGYEFNQDLLSFSFGAGINQNIGDIQLDVDYSYSKVKLFGGVNRFSLNIGF
jgi:hypothetical protein